MLISDVIKVIGDTPLGDFPWGCAVITTVNEFVDEGPPLTLNSNGEDLRRAIYTMTSIKRNIVLKARLDTAACSIKTDVGSGLYVEHKPIPEVVAPNLHKFTKYELGAAAFVIPVLLGAMYTLTHLSGGSDKMDWILLKKIGQVLLSMMMGQ